MKNRRQRSSSISIAMEQAVAWERSSAKRKRSVPASTSDCICSQNLSQPSGIALP